MRVTTKTDGDVLAKQLAEHVCTCRSSKHVIIAEDSKLDVNEEATQKAQAYWMMGWTWDEIESILEDSEYSSAVVSYAMKHAKEYASKILNEGPFAVLEAGQNVKLVNGEVGRLEDRHVDHVTVKLSSGLVKLTDKQLDKEATDKFNKAYKLRNEACVMLASLDNASLGISVSASKRQSETMLQNKVSRSLTQIEYTKQAMDAAKVAILGMKECWNRRPASWDKVAVQNVAAIIGQGLETDQEFDEVVYKGLYANLTEMYNALLEKDATDGSPVVDYLQDTLPQVLDKITSYAEDTAKTRMFGDVKASVDVWTASRKFTDMWKNELVPEIQRGSSIVESYMQYKSQNEIGHSVHAALKNNGF